MRTRMARAALAIALATATAVGAAGQQAPPKSFTERVDVQRVLLDVRVTDGLGQPIEQLTAADFVVRIDGKRVPVESASWVTGALRSDGFIASPAGPSATTTPGVEGRLIVFVIQKSLEEPGRILG